MNCYSFAFVIQAVIGGIFVVFFECILFSIIVVPVPFPIVEVIVSHLFVEGLNWVLVGHFAITIPSCHTTAQSGVIPIAVQKEEFKIRLQRENIKDLLDTINFIKYE
jgi:hypothetical protein